MTLLPPIAADSSSQNIGNIFPIPRGESRFCGPAQSSEITEPFLFPEDHASDRLRKILFKKGYIDAFGDGTPLLDRIGLFDLGECARERVHNFYEKMRHISFGDAYKNVYHIEYTLNEFLEYLQGCSGAFHRDEIAGTAVIVALGLKPFTNALEMLGITPTQELFSPEFLSLFEGLCNDEDMRIHYPGISWDRMEMLKKAAVNFFVTKLHVGSGGAEGLDKIVLSSAFHKLYHCPSYQQVIDPASLKLHYLTISPRDNFKTEICLVGHMARQHLFRSDAIQIVRSQSERGKISLNSDLSTPYLAIIDRLLGVIDADNVDEIDHNGWPRYISQLLRGKVCLKGDVERRLTQLFVSKIFEGKDIPPLSHIIYKIYENHHGNGCQQSSGTLMESLPLYVLNALVVARRHLPKEEDFKKFRGMLTGCVPLNQDLTIYGTLSRLLKNEHLPFELLEAFIGLFALNLYMDDDEAIHDFQRVVMRSHCGGAALQVSVEGDVGKNMLLVPMDVNGVLNKLSGRAGIISEAAVKDLLLLYRLLKPAGSKVSTGHRLGKYLTQMRLDISSLHLISLELLETFPLHLKEVVHDFICSLHGLEVKDVYLIHFLRKLPLILDSCADSRQFQMICGVLDQLFVRYQLSEGGVFSSGDSQEVEEAKSVVLEKAAFILSQSLCDSYYPISFHLFKASGSPKFKEFISEILPVGVHVACKAFKLAVEKGVMSFTDILEVFPLFVEIPFMGSFERSDLSEGLLRCLESCDGEESAALIPHCLRYIQRTGLKCFPALIEVVLSRARIVPLNVTDLALFLSLWGRHLDAITSQSSDPELRRLLSEHGDSEFSGEVRIRCTLGILTNMLRSHERLTKEMLDQFTMLQHMEGWHVFKAEMDACFNAMYQKAVSGSTIHLFMNFLTNPSLSGYLETIPDVVVETILAILRKVPQQRFGGKLDSAISLCLDRILVGMSMEHLSEFIAYMESNLLNRGLREILIPYVPKIADCIQRANQQALMIRLFQVCAMHGILYAEAVNNLNYCLWAFEEGSNPDVFPAYAKLVQNLMMNSDDVVVEELKNYEQLMRAVFNSPSVLCDARTATFWLGMLAWRGAVGVAYENLFDLVKNLYCKNLVEGVTEVLDAFERYRMGGCFHQADIVRYSDFWRSVVGGVWTEKKVVVLPAPEGVNEETKLYMIDCLISCRHEFMKSSSANYIVNLLRYNILDPVIWLEVIEFVGKGRNIEAKKLIWPLIEGELERLAIFEADLSMKERAYLAAAICLKDCDSDLCYALLSQEKPGIMERMHHRPTNVFVHKYFCHLALGVVRGIKMPATDEGYERLCLTLERYAAVLTNNLLYDEISAELDVLCIERFASCKIVNCYKRLWYSLYYLIQYTNQGKNYCYLHFMLMDQFPFLAEFCLEDGYEIIGEVTTRMIDKYLGSFDLTRMFAALKSTHSCLLGSLLFVICEHIQKLVDEGKSLNLSRYSAAIEKQISLLISPSQLPITKKDLRLNRVAANKIMNLNWVREVLNKAPLEQTKVAPSKSKNIRNRTAGKRLVKSKELTAIQMLRFELFKKLITQLTLHEYEEDVEEYRATLTGVIYQLSSMFRATLDQEGSKNSYLSALYKTIVLVADKSGDVEELYINIERIFEELNEIIFTSQELFWNDKFVDRDIDPCSASCSSSSAPVVVSNSKIPFKKYLKQFSPRIMLDDLFMKKGVYFNHVKLFVDVLIKCRTNNPHVNTYLRNVANQSFEYLLSSLPPEDLHAGFISLFLSYCGLDRFFCDEETYYQHRDFCTRIVEKYNSIMSRWESFSSDSRLILSYQDQVSFRLLLVDPNFHTRFKKNEFYYSQVELIVNTLVKIKTRVATVVALDILKVHCVDLLNNCPKRWINILNSFGLIWEGGAFILDHQGHYVANRVVDILVEKVSLKDQVTWKQLVKLQEKFMQLMVQRDVYEGMSLEILKVHFELVIAFIMKRYQFGGFILNLAEFEQAILGLKALMEYIEGTGKDGLFDIVAARVIALMNFCSLNFPINSKVQPKLSEIFFKYFGMPQS